MPYHLAMAPSEKYYTERNILRQEEICFFIIFFLFASILLMLHIYKYMQKNKKNTDVSQKMSKFQCGYTFADTVFSKILYMNNMYKIQREWLHYFRIYSIKIERYVKERHRLNEIIYKNP